MCILEAREILYSLYSQNVHAYFFRKNTFVLAYIKTEKMTLYPLRFTFYISSVISLDKYSTLDYSICLLNLVLTDF